MINDNTKTLVIMGNGPSLRDIDFNILNDIDTFGLNSAYRAYYRMNWWPTYHGCFDYRVTESHKQEFKKLTLGVNPIKRFFYLQQVSDSNRLTRIILSGGFRGSSQKTVWQDNENAFQSFSDGGNSGANACRVGVCMGYKKIILVGVDCNYKEIIDGAAIKKSSTSNFLQMEETPKSNPNYWFDDYQQKGDVYNLPQRDIFQKPGWEILSQQADENNIKIINCSEISTLTCFPKQNINQALLEKDD